MHITLPITSQSSPSWISRTGERPKKTFHNQSPRKLFTRICNRTSIPCSRAHSGRYHPALRHIYKEWITIYWVCYQKWLSLATLHFRYNLQTIPPKWDPKQTKRLKKNMGASLICAGNVAEATIRGELDPTSFYWHISSLCKGTVYDVWLQWNVDLNVSFGTLELGRTKERKNSWSQNLFFKIWNLNSVLHESPNHFAIFLNVNRLSLLTRSLTGSNWLSNRIASRSTPHFGRLRWMFCYWTCFCS